MQRDAQNIMQLVDVLVVQLDTQQDAQNVMRLLVSLCCTCCSPRHFEGCSEYNVFGIGFVLYLLFSKTLCSMHRIRCGWCWLCAVLVVHQDTWQDANNTMQLVMAL